MRENNSLLRWAFWVLPLLFFCFPRTPRVFSQDINRVAVFPTESTDTRLTSDDAWQVARYFAIYLENNLKLTQQDADTTFAYFQNHRLPSDTTKTQLSRIADDLQVNLLLLTSVVSRDDGFDLRVSMYDAEIAVTTKTVSQSCGCQLNNPDTFPFRRIVELLFNAPEIILTQHFQTTELPPPPIEIPPLPNPADSSAVAPKQVLSPRQRGPAWRRYAAGALIVTGGIVYLTSRGRADGEDSSPQKLADPPGPPGSQ